MARASDFGSGDPGSILGRVGVFVSLSKRHLLPKKVLVIPRNRWLRLNMTEKLFTGTLNHNQKKKKKKKKKCKILFLIKVIIPPANCVCGRVYCFHVVCPSVRPKVRPSARVSVTFCFLNILMNH